MSSSIDDTGENGTSIDSSGNQRDFLGGGARYDHSSRGLQEEKDIDSIVREEAAEFDERHGTVWRDGFYSLPI